MSNVTAESNRPWKSEPTVEGVQSCILQSWKAFDQYVKEELANAPALIYRGQANAKWPIMSKLDRLEKRFPRTPNTSSKNPSFFNCPPMDRATHLEKFQSVAIGRRGRNPPDLNEEEWWALGQHHGLATPLLDWCRSPFVALFFAFEEEKPNGETPEERVVLALSTSVMAGIKNSHPDAPVVYAPVRETSPRLLSQGSQFLMTSAENPDLEAFVRSVFREETYRRPSKLHPVTVLTKIIIANQDQDRIDCLKYLNLMNINRSTLFPDLDGASNYINSLWELGGNTSLGYLEE